MENAAPEGCPLSGHSAARTRQLDTHQAPAAPPLQAPSEKKAKNQLWDKSEHLLPVLPVHLFQPPQCLQQTSDHPAANTVTGLPALII